MVDVKRANELHWAVKGHLIPEGYELDEIQKIYDSYMLRMWGNHEYCYRLDGFEEAWEERQMRKVVMKGYD